MHASAAAPPGEWSRFFRSADLPGAEALHARFVSHRYAAHFHETWTIATVESGAASFTLGATRYMAPAPSVFFIPPGAVHTGEPASPGGYLYRVLYLHPQQDVDDGGPTVLAGQLVDSAARRVVVEDRHLTSRLAQIHRLLPLAGHALEQGEALASVVVTLTGIAPRQEPQRPNGQRIVTLAVDYIRAHWQDDFNLGDLSRATGASRYHLVRTFHRQMGLTPSVYRRALRIAEARNLLRRGERPADVATMCGFYDQSHLNRHFKLIVGVTPRQYARAQGK
jgi:AraC-like DNA-binding protein